MLRNVPAVLAFGAVCCAGGTLAAEPRVRLDATGDTRTVVVEGLAPDRVERLRTAEIDRETWPELFGVYTGDASARADGLPAMLGSWRVEAERIRFTPRFPFLGGMTYWARLDGARLDAIADFAAATPSVEITFNVPDSSRRSAPHVVSVYPSVGVVPENLLRLYVHFSASMNPKDAQQYVRLVDSSGRPVTLPFVEIQHGLWDPAHRRLTLFLHPGRIKRGVAPNLEMGPPLRRGETFRLIVDGSMRDAAGHALGSDRVTELVVQAPDHVSPDPRRWTVSRPDGADPSLTVTFDEPLDHALSRRMIRVVDATGEPIAGRPELSADGLQWSFRPGTDWRAGEYAIRVDPALEDLAGNRLDRLFEVAPTPTGSDATDGDRPTVEIPFRVGSRSEVELSPDPVQS